MQLAVGLDIPRCLGRMAYADIDVEAELLIGKRAVPYHVFGILGVR